MEFDKINDSVDYIPMIVQCASSVIIKHCKEFLKCTNKRITRFPLLYNIVDGEIDKSYPSIFLVYMSIDNETFSIVGRTVDNMIESCNIVNQVIKALHLESLQSVCFSIDTLEVVLPMFMEECLKHYKDLSLPDDIELLKPIQVTKPVPNE